jgi:hypothetical protein
MPGAHALRRLDRIARSGVIMQKHELSCHPGAQPVLGGWRFKNSLLDRIASLPDLLWKLLGNLVCLATLLAI